MRSARLFRNEKIAFALRPFWDSFCFRNFGRTSLVTKNAENCEHDPYEGNYSFLECDLYTKVTVIGAAGRVGRTLSLLLKTCPLVDHLCLFDINKAVKGIKVDLSHIDTKCCVSYVCGMRNIQQALDGPDVVVIAAGYPSSPNLQDNKLFDKNAPIVAGLSEACARFCPKACVVLITNPINSLLPVVGEVYKTITNRIPMNKMFGLTTLDVVRANTFVAEAIRKDPNGIIVPVIGGASQETIVPVISQMKPCCKLKHGEVLALTECIKRAENNLSDCQNCGTRGASSLSTAYAAFRFTSSLVMALKGAEDIVECAFVKSDIIPELEYLASPLKLGIRGIQYNYGYPPLSDYELAGLEQAAASLISDINLGKSFVITIEETIREGLIWKRLSEEASKTEKSQSLEKKIKDLVLRRKRLEERKKAEEKAATEDKKAGEESAIIKNNVIYTHSVDWGSPAKTSLKRLLNPDEASQQEVTAESISAEVDGCRGDPSLHEKIFEDSKLKDQPFHDEIDLLENCASFVERSSPQLHLLRSKNAVKQFLRNFHTMRKKMSNFEERNLRRRKQDNFKMYLDEDRKKIQEQNKPPIAKVEQEVRTLALKTLKPVRFDEAPKNFSWEEKYVQNHYKDLNVAAKQKIRIYNCQKKFNPSASVLLMLKKMKKEKIEKSLIASIQEKSEKRFGEYKQKIQEKEVEAEDENEQTKDENVSIIVPEKDENTKHREFVMKQLEELKKENDLLKKRLVEMTKEKKLETALQVQTDHLELERTKLKACWLIMTSTMDAFSNFCKKFTSKTNPKSLEKAVQEIEVEEEASDDDEYEDAVEEQKNPKVDDKYFQFLQKLMEDQMGSKKLRKTV